MILEQETFEKFKHYPSKLTYGSNKPILAACNECGAVRETSKSNYHALCGSCAHIGNTNALGCTHSKRHSNYTGGQKASNARRRRQLGYTLLMPLAEGEVGHHVTNEYVIGIPEEVHQKLSGGRRKHRTKILQWLKANNKKKYKKVLCVLAKEITV